MPLFSISNTVTQVSGSVLSWARSDDFDGVVNGFIPVSIPQSNLGVIVHDEFR